MTHSISLTDAPAGLDDVDDYAVDGAPVDLDQAFRDHSAFLMRSVERLTGAGAHVEDIVQDVFVVAHRKGSALPGGPALRGYLYGIARHKALHHKRFFARLRRLREAFGHAPAAPGVGPDEAISRQQSARLIREATLRLPFELREVFVLHELEALSARQIAALIAIPEGTVWSRLSSARAAFKAAYLVASSSTARGAP